MKHFGDITKLDGHKLPLVDIITGGSPCQDLSVAKGKRAGLDGERSGLFMEQIRIIKEMREESERRLRDQGTAYDRRMVKPRYMVWENVPGAFSSNKGEDFRIVLEETARIVDKDAVIPGLASKQKWTPSGCILGDGWSIAWRLHNSEFFGVPQRRRRLALVADLGGQSAPEILFERKSVSGNTEPSREERETTVGSSCGDLKKTNPAHTSYSIGNGQLHDALTPSKEVSKTLNCMDDPAKVLVYGFDPGATRVVYALDRASFNQGKNALYDFSVEEEIAQPIVARGPGGGTDTIGALQARDYKGVGNQYVNEGKCIIQRLGKSSSR